MPRPAAPVCTGVQTVTLRPRACGTKLQRRGGMPRHAGRQLARDGARGRRRPRDATSAAQTDRPVSAWRRGGVATSAAVQPEVLPWRCNGPARCCAGAPFPCIPARMHCAARQAMWPHAAVPPGRRRPAAHFDVPCMAGALAHHILHPYDGTRRSAAMQGPGSRKHLRGESGFVTAAANHGGGGAAVALDAGVAATRAPLWGHTGLDAGGEELQRPGRGKRSRTEEAGLAIAGQAVGAAHVSAPPVSAECGGDDAFVGMVRVCRCRRSCRTRGRCVGTFRVLLCMSRRV